MHGFDGRIVLGTDDTFHLHGFDGDERVAFFHGLAGLHRNGDNVTGHGCADVGHVSIFRLGPGFVGQRHACLGNAYGTALAIQLEEQAYMAFLVHIRAALQANHERLAAVDLHSGFFVIGHSVKEHGRGQDGNIVVLAVVLGEFSKHFRVHQIGSKVCIVHLAPDGVLGLGALGFQVGGRHEVRGAARDRGGAFEHFLRNVFGKVARRKPEFPAHHGNHGFGKSDLPGRIAHVFRGEIVGHHEDRQIAHYFRGGCHLDDVAEQKIHLRISLRHFRPAMIETHGARLLAQVGVLPAGHFVQIHVRSARAHIRLEGCVVAAHRFPIARQRFQRFEVHARIAFGTLQGRHHRSQIGLRGKPAHGIQGAIHRIATGLDSS